jgi:hypothetical protein
MYDVWRMRRTNIYLDDRQLDVLRRLSDDRGQPVAALVREAVDVWLAAQGAQPVGPDEWVRRFDALLERRRALATAHGFDAETVDRDVLDAVRETRTARGR